MAEGNERTETAKRNDDSAMIESQEPAPGQSGASGGELAREIGARDEEARLDDAEVGSTRVEKADKLERSVPTRADNDGANG